MIEMAKRLSKCIREYKFLSIISPILVLGEVVLEVLIPYYMADLIDKGIEVGNMDFIISCGIKLAIFAILSLVLGALGAITATKASAGFAKNLTHDMYHHIQEFSFANIDKFSTAGLTTRLTTDVSNVQMAFQMLIRGAMRAPSMLIFTLIMAFRVNNKLPFVFTILIPILGFGLFVIFKYAMPLFEKVFKLYDKLNNVVQENLRGIRVVKAFVREDHETEKFKAASKEMYDTNLKAEYIMAAMMPLMQTSTYLCTILISWFGAKLVISTALTTGQLMSLMTYIMQILISLVFLSMIIMMSSIATAAGKRICEVLDEVPDIQNIADPVTEIESGSIELRHVNFGYPNCSDCLTDINLNIKSGQTVGIVGGTGSGKTSLVQLIPRLYDARSGQVLVDGHDVRVIDMAVLRKNVSMVLQKNVLFAGTIAENLRWGKEDASDEEIKAACIAAEADGFINEFNEGYNYMLDQGGTNLSGGQRQRVCIARALIAKPKILILDDSTSAVDTATDARIRKAFRENLPNTTKLIIAQRISSVQDADLIVVIDGGKINGIGSHEELLATNEIYREVYDAQTKDGDFDA